MLLFNLFLAYLLIGVVFGVVNYLVTWRAFEREGRAGELPEDLLEKSVGWHALWWPSPVFWGALCLVVMLFFPKPRPVDRMENIRRENSGKRQF